MKLELPVQPDRYDIEREKLLEKDIEAIARLCWVNVVEKKSDTEYEVEIPLFSSCAKLSMPSGDMTCRETKFLSFLMKMLIMHYLCHGSDAYPSGTWITYTSLPDGAFYGTTLVQNFTMLAVRYGRSAKTLEEFKEVCTLLGGSEIEMGDAAFIIRVFPKIFLQVILHRGDEEFEPRAQILLDQRITSFLDIDFTKLLVIEGINRMLKIGECQGASSKGNVP